MSSAADIAADITTETEALLKDALAGLGASPKTLPCKYFYDTAGARLCEEICELEEYYPTRTELAIMDRSLGEMAAALGPDCLLVEFGSGSGQKTETLLAALDTPAGYVPIDVSREQLSAYAARLEERFPGLRVAPVCADFTNTVRLPDPPPAKRRVVYFPGSTIGNFDDGPALDLLRRIARLCGPGGGLLIGVDLVKDPAVLERAYDDSQGVTAAFNLNLLVRLNRELGADFDLEQFRHRAIYNHRDTRIEMYLESLRNQAVHVAGHPISFTEGEMICTEHSNKWTLEAFRQLAEDAGLRIEQVWTDEDDLFSVQYLEVITPVSD